MPDISMCNNILCKSKETCFRFKAKPNEFRQSYSNFTCEDEELNCSYYIKIDKTNDPYTATKNYKL